MAASSSSPPVSSGREPTVQIAVSACLLGEPVRYDGTDKRHGWLVDQLAQVAQLLPVCPELEAGLGVPRERINLVRTDSGQLRVLGETSGRDVTEPLAHHARGWLEQHPSPPLCGAVLKSRSPSCGTGTARLLDEQGRVLEQTWGVFAHQLRKRWPWLPIVDERQLAQADSCRGFAVRVFLLGRLFAAAAAGPQGLVRFHGREWLLLAALAPARIGSLDEAAAVLGIAAEEETAGIYRRQVLQAVAEPDCAAAHRRAWSMWLENYVADEDLLAEATEVVQAAFTAGRGVWQTAPEVAEQLRRRWFPQLARQTYAQPWPQELVLP